MDKQNSEVQLNNVTNSDNIENSEGVKMEQKTEHADDSTEKIKPSTNNQKNSTANSFHTQPAISESQCKKMARILGSVAKGETTNMFGSKVCHVNAKNTVIFYTDLSTYMRFPTDAVFTKQIVNAFKSMVNQDAVSITKDAERRKLICKTPNYTILVDIPTPTDKISFPVDEMTTVTEKTSNYKISADSIKSLNATLDKNKSKRSIRLLIFDSQIKAIAGYKDGKKVFASTLDFEPMPENLNQPDFVLETSEIFCRTAKEYSFQIKKDKDNQYWFFTDYINGQDIVNSAEKVFEPGKYSQKDKWILPKELPDKEAQEAGAKEAYDSIKNSNSGILTSKVIASRYLMPIFIHREVLLDNDEEREYIKKFYLYIQKLSGQAENTSRHDGRALKEFADRDWKKHFNPEMPDRYYLVKNIASAPIGLRDELVADIDNLDREKLAKRIKDYKTELAETPDETAKREKKEKESVDNFKTAVEKLGLSIRDLETEKLLALRKALNGLDEKELKKIISEEADSSKIESLSKEIDEALVEETADIEEPDYDAEAEKQRFNEQEYGLSDEEDEAEPPYDSKITFDSDSSPGEKSFTIETEETADENVA